MGRFVELDQKTEIHYFKEIFAHDVILLQKVLNVIALITL